MVIDWMMLVMRRETLARLLVALLIVIAFAIPFGGRRLSLAGDIPGCKPGGAHAGERRLVA
jgi:hypothetical protein